MASLGSLVVSLAMDTAQFTSGVGKSVQQMARLTAEAGKIGTAIGTNVATGIRVIGDLVKQTVDASVEIGNLAAVAGTTTEVFSAMATGVSTVGISQEKFADILKDTQDKLGDFLQNGAGPMKDFFDNIAPKVGVTAEQFRGLSGPDALQLYVSSLEKANLTQSEMVFYMEAIASDSALLLPLLAKGGEGFDKYAEAARRFGATVDADVVAQSKVMKDQFMILGLAKTGLANRITKDLLPTLTTMTDRLLGSATAAGTLDKISRIASSGVKVLASAGAIVVGVFKTLGEALGGVAAAVVAVFEGRFRDAFNIAQGVASDFTDNISSTIGDVQAIWSSVSDAVAASSEPLGAKIASPMVAAASKAKKAGKEVEDAALKAYESVEKQVASIQRDLMNYGQDDATIKLFDLEDAGATPEQLARARKYLEQLNSIKAATERQNKIQADAASAYEQTRTPLEVLNAELSRAQQLLDAGAISWDTYARMTDKAQDKIEKVGEASKETGSFAKDMGLTFSSAAEKAIMNLNDLGSVVKGLGQDILGILTRKMITEPLGNAITSFDWSSLLNFDGGGFTGRGARSGGLDGKGGFLAMLHPQETVVDHTKGQSTSGSSQSITVNNYVTVGSVASQQDVITGMQTVRAQMMADLQRNARYGGI